MESFSDIFKRIMIRIRGRLGYKPNNHLTLHYGEIEIGYYDAEEDYFEIRFNGYEVNYNGNVNCYSLEKLSVFNLATWLGELDKITSIKTAVIDGREYYLTESN